MNIHEKLMVIQSKLKAPKSQYNNFGKYAYRNCEDILEALKPLLAEVKAVININDEVVTIGDRFYIKATATLIDCEKPQDYITDCVRATAYAREEQDKKGMDGSQVTGSASSYARKYALNGLFAIDDTKDADSTNQHETKKPPQKANPAPPQANKPKQDKSPVDKMIASINAMAREIGMADGPLHAFLEAEHGVKSIKQLSLEDGRAFYNKLKALKEG